MTQRAEVACSEEALDAQRVWASVARGLPLGFVGDEGAGCVALRARLQKGGSVRTAGWRFGEGEEGFCSFLLVDARLAGRAGSAGHVAGLGVTGGVVAAVIVEEAGSSKVDEGFHDGSRGIGSGLH